MSLQGIEKYFIFIKNRVSADWKDLAWCLGFTTPDISNIDTKHRDDKSRCMELLQEWHKRKGNSATIHVLMEALQDAELQLVVDSLKDKYPELQEDLSPAASGPSQEMTASAVPIQGQVQTDRQETEVLVRSLTQEITRLTLNNEKTQRSLLHQKEEIQNFQESSMAKETRIKELTSENTKLLNQVTELSEKHANTQRQEVQQLQETSKGRFSSTEETLSTAGEYDSESRVSDLYPVYVNVPLARKNALCDSDKDPLTPAPKNDGASASVQERQSSSHRKSIPEAGFGVLGDTVRVAFDYNSQLRQVADSFWTSASKDGSDDSSQPS